MRVRRVISGTWSWGDPGASGLVGREDDMWGLHELRCLTSGRVAALPLHAIAMHGDGAGPPGELQPALCSSQQASPPLPASSSSLALQLPTWLGRHPSLLHVLHIL